MMGDPNDYGVRVLTAYENRQVGQVFYPPGVLREHLIRRGLVAAVEPPEPPRGGLFGNATTALAGAVATRRKR